MCVCMHDQPSLEVNAPSMPNAFPIGTTVRSFHFYHLKLIPLMPVRLSVGMYEFCLHHPLCWNLSIAHSVPHPNSFLGHFSAVHIPLWLDQRFHNILGPTTTQKANYFNYKTITKCVLALSMPKPLYNIVNCTLCM